MNATAKQQLLDEVLDRDEAQSPRERKQTLARAAHLLAPPALPRWQRNIKDMLIAAGFDEADIDRMLDLSEDPGIEPHAVANALLNLKSSDRKRHRLVGNHVAELCAIGARNALLWKVADATSGIDLAEHAQNPGTPAWAREPLLKASRTRGDVTWNHWLQIWWAYGKRDK